MPGAPAPDFRICESSNPLREARLALCRMQKDGGRSQGRRVYNHEGDGALAHGGFSALCAFDGHSCLETHNRHAVEGATGRKLLRF
jgi:hypothetical protein